MKTNTRRSFFPYLALLLAALLLLGIPAGQATLGDAQDAMDQATGEEASAPDSATLAPGEERRTLVIAGQAYASDMNPAFAIAYPQVDVRFNESPSQTADQLMLAMTTDHAAADLYVLNISSGLFDAAQKKGLALDLSGSPVLSEFSAAMAPFIRERLTQGQALYALPYQLFSQQLIAINQPVAEYLGIPQPGSLVELAERYAAWVEQEGTEGLFLSSRPLWNPVSRFLIWGLDAYIAEYAEGDNINYDTPAFRDYIALLERLRAPLAHLNEEHSGWQEHLKDKALIIEEYPLLKTQEDIGISLPGLKPLALPLQSGGTPVIPVEMSLFMVNAASPNQELAIKYLECLAKNYPPQQRILLFDSFREPVEQENYRENLEVYQQKKELLEKQLADPEHKDRALDIQEELKKVDFILEEIASQRWLITPEDIALYEAVKPHLRLMPRISYAFYDALPATKKLFFNFVNGDIDAKNFVEQLNQTQRLINLEGQ